MNQYTRKAQRKKCLELARTMRANMRRKKRRYIVRDVALDGIIFYSVAPDSEEALSGWLHTEKRAADFLAALLNLAQHLTAWGLAEQSAGIKQNV